MKRPVFLKKAGIYIIICIANLKMYIGSSSSLATRFSEHRSELRRKEHPNGHLQNAWNKYGEEMFLFGVLEYSEDVDNLFIIEQHYLDKYRSFNKNIGFNLSKSAEGVRGLIVSEENRRKARERQLGRIKGPETVQLLKDAWVENREAWTKKAIDDRGISFQIVSPEGVLYTVKGVKQFAKTHGLDPKQLSRVIKGKNGNKMIKGWHLPDAKLKEPFHIKDPEGVVHTVPYRKLTKFCKERDVHPFPMGQMLGGKRDSYQGWTRGND